MLNKLSVKTKTTLKKKKKERKKKVITAECHDRLLYKGSLSDFVEVEFKGQAKVWRFTRGF